MVVAMSRHQNVESAQSRLEAADHLGGHLGFTHGAVCPPSRFGCSITNLRVAGRFAASSLFSTERISSSCHGPNIIAPARHHAVCTWPTLLKPEKNRPDTSSTIAELRSASSLTLPGVTGPPAVLSMCCHPTRLRIPQANSARLRIMTSISGPCHRPRWR
jgi:hypothetical protein